jgi:hypothetical protein
MKTKAFEDQTWTPANNYLEIYKLSISLQLMKCTSHPFDFASAISVATLIQKGKLTDLRTVQKCLPNTGRPGGEVPMVPAVAHALPNGDAEQHPQQRHWHPVPAHTQYRHHQIKLAAFSIEISGRRGIATKYVQAACEDENGERRVVARVPPDVLLDA